MFEDTINTHCKARKEHTCTLCGKTINKGEIHVSYNTKRDGYYKTTKYHMECEIEHEKQLSEQTYQSIKHSVENNPQFYRV